jgi:hypothetical protein
MNLERRVELLKKLGEYIISDDEKWAIAKEKAHYENGWFIPGFVDYQLKHIAHEYLNEIKLRNWIARYSISETANPLPKGVAPGAGKGKKTIGIVMAGNIPLAGMHDFISTFISGHNQTVKPSSKDTILINAIIDKLKEWEPSLAQTVTIAQQLKGCDAYIATGSNNSARYFEYYFSKYPHIIRRNRTSVAVLAGNETIEDLAALADDVYLYFGLGCRNVTKLYVPREYDFVPLLESFKKYNWVFDHNKYRNNYDYQLAVLMINRILYMTNGSIILQENNSLFSPISQLHFERYDDVKTVFASLENNTDVQCIVGPGYVPFGQAQKPALNDYADKADTLKFLTTLS